LSYGRSALASLDVDKVYAVLGLSVETFGVDYKESVIDTYLRLAAHIVARQGGLALLDLVEDHAFRLRVNLPSWVPDWEVRHGPRLLKASPHSGTWNASLDATPYTRPLERPRLYGRYARSHWRLIDRASPYVWRSKEPSPKRIPRTVS
jgi:hypothetical protein